jgi:5-methylcytosine-specific restriction protein A
VFELGKVYRRRDLHAEFRGQEQGGIVTPVSYPLIFVITGDAGLRYGYQDEERADGTFLLYGEGQEGDMSFVRGNRAVRDHALNGRDLHLFEKVRPAHLRYRGQYVCAGYETVSDVPDVNNDLRTAIAFHLAPLEGDEDDAQAAEKEVAELSIDQLRRAALEAPARDPSSSNAKRVVYYRAAAVHAYVLARADGSCEGCGVGAPFRTPAGKLYLEPHHTRRISDGGPDHPGAVIALCPTCHRRVHHATDGDAYNHVLMANLVRIEDTIR